MINNPVHKQLPTLENPGTAIDLRSGKSLIAPDGSVVTGTVPEVEQATPSISVSSGGLITATAAQVGGIVTTDSKSATKQLTTQGTKTVTPTTTEQIAVASGRYTTGDVKVAGDANLTPENIAEGVSIFGVSGTFKSSSVTAKGYQTFSSAITTVSFPSNTNAVIGSISSSAPFSTPEIFMFVRDYSTSYSLAVQTSVNWSENNMRFLNCDGETLQFICFE